MEGGHAEEKGNGQLFEGGEAIYPHGEMQNDLKWPGCLAGQMCEGTTITEKTNLSK